ncbi:DUF928 domain-containing protein [Microseira sp. BLCC-F43]|jgi:hypothetical protein|uniref:DUF928 domain-containing protein n=1 Tax=Microseira sp. BLCC-F43 TaxID=3153602 RepID=UPI0035BA051B
MKLWRYPITSLFTITWAFVSLTSARARGWAQFHQPINNLFIQQSQIKNQNSRDFAEDGIPSSGNRTGGASRSPCPYTNPPLTALMPIINRGKTVADRPTLWFYVPYSSQQASAGEFVLKEEGNKEIFRIPFTLPRTPGLVSFSIPSTKAPLEIDKEYVWFFKVICQQQEASVSEPSLEPGILVQGWVQRVKPTPELESELKAKTEPEYTIYTNHLIWYDALDSLTKLRITQPTNTKLTDEWINLFKLKGIEGDDLDPQKLKQPIVGSVVVQSSQ